ncbi:MAG TPA: hypothetical protein PLS48_12125 [Methanotrichaceae archaeon]|nr:MAG: hypothetical protein A4E47_01700 [Methanosaeta sp. PtaU1.Bin028]HQI92367.1 hypothetical protein [Methanotrichaceae archaeon]
MELERAADLRRVKEVLSRVDPKIAMMAIMRSEVDSDEVEQIKKELSKYKHESVMEAVAELDQEYMLEEVNRVSSQLAAFDKSVVDIAVADAVADSNFDIGAFGICADVITCRGSCVMRMTFKSKCQMVMNPGMGNRVDWVINQSGLRAKPETSKLIR